MTTLAVAGLGLYAPGYPTLDAWLADKRDAALPAPTGELIDARTRRRASPFTRALADAYGQALSAGRFGKGLDASTVGAVFGSALGEVGTMIALLDQMWRGDGALSPMRFATSVHNAASGVVSITTKNRGFTTSIGADFDTPAMALVEAFAYCVTHDQPVIVVCGDEAAPGNLVSGLEGGWEMLTAAVALVPLSRATAAMPRLRGPVASAPSLPGAEAPPVLANNPVAGLLDLVDALGRGRRGVARLDRGRGRGVCFEILAAP
jgi:hypothetical protein